MEKFKEILLIALVVIVVCAALACVGLTIYAFAKYGNTPIAEVPTWAVWFMFGGGRKWKQDLSIKDMM